MDRAVQAVRMFHYAVRLPVWDCRGGRIVSSLPENPARACGLLAESRAQDGCGRPGSRAGEEGALSLEEELSLDSVEAGAPCYLAGRYEERYFCYMERPGDGVICGPYVHSGFGENDVTRIIRSFHLRLDRRELLVRHYAALPRLTDVQAYYASQLLKQLMAGTGMDFPETAAPLQESQVTGEVMENTYRNRMALFHHPPYFFEQEISRQIIAGARENALQLLQELNQMERAHLADTPLRSLKNSLIASVTLFTRAAISGGVPYGEAFTLSDSFIQLIERQRDMDVLNKVEETIVLRFIDTVEKHRTSHYSDMIRTCIAYIDENLTEDLSASVIAGKLFVHPDYLSARFRQETGERLHRYILRRRVEEAAHFMRYSSERISDIAAFYRFSSQSHFISAFRQYMGTTPGKYREQ